MILKKAVIIVCSFFLLIVASPSLAEDPWDSYKGWSGIEDLSGAPSWYLVIRKKGEQIVSVGNVFLKWYKYENSNTDMRPNHWRINSTALSGQGSDLWIRRGLYYQDPFARNTWRWNNPSQSKPSFTLVDGETVLDTKNPQQGDWLGRMNEVRVFGRNTVESKYVTEFKIVDELTWKNYGAGGKEKYDEYIVQGILVENIEEGKHRIRPEVTVKTTFDQGSIDGAYEDFYLTFVNNRAVTFYVDRHDPVVTITSVKNKDGSPGFPGPKDARITYVKSTEALIYYNLSDNLSSLGSFQKAATELRWIEGTLKTREKDIPRSNWGIGSIIWENLSDFNQAGGKDYVVAIGAWDKADNWGSIEETIYVDTHLPECSIDSVEVRDGAYVHIEGNGEPLSAYAIYGQGDKGQDVLLTDPDDWSTYESMSSSKYRVNSAGKWEFDVGIDEVDDFIQGGNLLKIKIKSRDFAQNEYESNYHEFTIDMKRPSLIWEVFAGDKSSGIISETNPPDEIFYFNEDTLTVETTAQDESGIEKICYMCDLYPDSQTVFSDSSFPQKVSENFFVGPFQESKDLHWLRVYAIDRAGWTSAAHTLSFIVDKTSPQKPILTSSPYVNGDTVLLTGKGEVGTDIEVYELGSLLVSTIVYSEGNWSIEIDNIAVGDHFLTLKSVDRAGNFTINENPIKVTVLVKKPPPPIISQPKPGEIITDTYTPVFKGTTLPEGIVELYDYGVMFGETQADKEGKFSFTPQKGLNNGYHSLCARVYKDGAISEISEAVEWQLSVGGYIGKQDLLLVAPDEVVEDSEFAVNVYDKETGKPISDARVVFLGKEYITDERGKTGAKGSAFRLGVVASPLKEITEEMQGAASLRYADKDFKGEIKMVTLFVEKGGKSADQDIAVKKGGGHKFGTFNRDGSNDRVHFSEPEDYPIHIYDRLGRRVKTLSESEGSWDGLDDNGNRVKMGVYIYQTRNGETGTIFVRR